MTPCRILQGRRHSPGNGFQPDLPLGRLPSRSEHGSWTFLKRFSHEGARVLQDVVDFAAEMKADCIVMGSHKPGLADYLLGSTAARVVRHAPCAVHVMRDPG